MARKKVEENSKQLSLLDFIAKARLTEAPQKIEEFEGFLREVCLNSDKKTWRGLVMTPPASFLSDLILQFDKYSDFPLELPYFIFMHMLSGQLINEGIQIEYNDEMRWPQLWSILVCASGGGKTSTINAIQKNFGINSIWEPGGVQSRASFIEGMAENNKKLMVLDEAGMHLKKMKAGQPLEQVKTDMLNISVNKQIDHKTVKSTNITIKEPVISFLGATTEAPLENAISWEDVYSGFCQRIRWIFADRTKPIKPAQHIRLEHLQRKWKCISEKINHKVYKAPKLAEEAFESSFHFFRSSYEKMDASYFKRIMDEAHSYALLFHIILGKGNEEVLDLEDYGWAGRVLGVLFQDAQRFLREKVRSEIDKTLDRVAEVVHKIEAEGRECTPRDIMRAVYKIRTAKQASEYLAKIKSGEYQAPDDKAYDV